MKKPLQFNIVAECSTTRARTAVMRLPHGEVKTPVFMPVGTKGTLKGLLPNQLEKLNCDIMLGNTYHLGNRPGSELVESAGGLHNFMKWKKSLLTDSGGFQMVSLLKLSEITESGVKFRSPFDDSECLLTPEESIAIQNRLGADIIMQLDDVVSSTNTDKARVTEAMERTIRWLDRSIKANKHPDKQNLFPIVQGGLYQELRKECAEKLVKRNCNGYAIGGLSGGESKDEFWKMVKISAEVLPNEKPKYVMGVGFAEDILVCCALGCDMFDCVFPTRTARFGCALTFSGQINLKQKRYAEDYRPIDSECCCSTCKTYTRAYLSTIVTHEAVSCHLLTIHNIAFQMKLMNNIRQSIQSGSFVRYVKDFMSKFYPDNSYPPWSVEAFKSVGICLS